MCYAIPMQSCKKAPRKERPCITQSGLCPLGHIGPLQAGCGTLFRLVEPKQVAVRSLGQYPHALLMPFGILSSRRVRIKQNFRPPTTLKSPRTPLWWTVLKPVFVSQSLRNPV